MNSKVSNIKMNSSIYKNIDKNEEYDDKIEEMNFSKSENKAEALLSTRKDKNTIHLDKISMSSFYDNMNKYDSYNNNKVSVNLQSEALEILKNLDDPEFNIFNLENYLGDKILGYISREVFNEKGYFEKLIKETTFNNFIEEVIKGYSRVIPYHNDIHAADVFQTVFAMFSQGDLEEVSNRN